MSTFTGKRNGEREATLVFTPTSCNLFNWTWKKILSGSVQRNFAFLSRFSFIAPLDVMRNGLCCYNTPFIHFISVFLIEDLQDFDVRLQAISFGCWNVYIALSSKFLRQLLRVKFEVGGDDWCLKKSQVLRKRLGIVWFLKVQYGIFLKNSFNPGFWNLKVRIQI